jgi:hypothetical protein
VHDKIPYTTESIIATIHATLSVTVPAAARQAELDTWHTTSKTSAPQGALIKATASPIDRFKAQWSSALLHDNVNRVYVLQGNIELATAPTACYPRPRYRHQMDQDVAARHMAMQDTNFFEPRYRTRSVHTEAADELLHIDETYCTQDYRTVSPA